jgi:hypothetical protein
MSDILVATAVQLEKEMKCDVVNATIQKRTSDLGSHGAPLSKRSSVSNVLAGPAKELEKQITADHVSAGLSKRSSQQELLDRGVLKRPTNESNIIAGAAVTLEKALVSDKVSGKIAEKVRAYVGNANEEKTSAPKDVEIVSTLKDRMNAYMTAVKETNSTPKSPSMGEGIKERMKAYQDAAKSSPKAEKSPIVLDKASPTTVTEPLQLAPSSPKIAIELSTTESPKSSIKERMGAYQEAVQGKSSPKSPITGVPSLKERLAAYQETVSNSPTNIKKHVDILPSEEGVKERLSAYMEATTSSPTNAANATVEEGKGDSQEE